MKIKLNFSSLNEELETSKDPLNEVLRQLGSFWKHLSNAGKLVRLDDFADVISRSRRVLDNFKLPRSLGAKLDGKAMLRSIFDSTSGLETQMNDVIASVVDQLRRGEAVPLGDGRTSTGAARISFDGIVDLPEGLPVPSGPTPIKIYMTIDKDGVVEGSVGIGETGRRRSMKSWKESGGKASGTRSATRRGADAADQTSSLHPEDLKWLEENNIDNASAREFYEKQMADVRRDMSTVSGGHDHFLDFQQAIRTTTERIQSGNVVVLNADQTKKIFNKMENKIVQAAEDAGKIKPGEELYLPLVDEAGRVVINQDGQTAIIVLGQGDTAYATGRVADIRYTKSGHSRLSGGGERHVVKLSDELGEMIQVTENLNNANIAFYQAWKRLKERLDLAGPGKLRKFDLFKKFMNEALQGWWKIFNQELKSWMVPWSNDVIKYSDLPSWKKAMTALDVFAGFGVTKATAAGVTSLLRSSGKVSRSYGLGASRSAAKLFVVMQGSYYATMVLWAAVYWLSNNLKEERENYEFVMNPPEDADARKLLIEYLHSLTAFYKKHNEVMPKWNEDMSLQQLRYAVKETHKNYLKIVEDKSGASPAEIYAFHQNVGIPLVPDNVIDVVENFYGDVENIADLSPEDRKIANAEHREAGSTLNKIQQTSDDALEKVRGLGVDFGVGKEKAKRGQKPRPKIAPKAKTPTQGTPSDPGTQDSSLGDLSGIDDSLFEIFNTGKPISIKVKSSSLRLRAKITEKK